jgi:thiol-disulfide isomerase/thioredoxin
MMIMKDKIEEKYPEVKFIAIDVDYFKNLCLRFGIESIPNIIVFKDGKECKRIAGLVLTSAFKSAFGDICNMNPNNGDLHGKESRKD